MLMLILVLGCESHGSDSYVVFFLLLKAMSDLEVGAWADVGLPPSGVCQHLGQREEGTRRKGMMSMAQSGQGPTVSPHNSRLEPDPSSSQMLLPSRLGENQQHLPTEAWLLTDHAGQSWSQGLGRRSLDATLWPVSSHSWRFEKTSH